VTVAVWPTDSPVPGLATPAVAELLVVVAVELELAAAEAAPPDVVEPLPVLDDPPLDPHAPTSAPTTTAASTVRPT
jgi:hypothetical protein